MLLDRLNRELPFECWGGAAEERGHKVDDTAEGRTRAAAWAALAASVKVYVSLAAPRLVSNCGLISLTFGEDRLELGAERREDCRLLYRYRVGGCGSDDGGRCCGNPAVAVARALPYRRQLPLLRRPTLPGLLSMASVAPNVGKCRPPCGGSTLCVRVTAPVRWRKANDPRLHRPDRKGQRDFRLRLLNADVSSFNKLLTGDMVVSSDRSSRPGKKRAGRGYYVKRALGACRGFG